MYNYNGIVSICHHLFISVYYPAHIDNIRTLMYTILNVKIGVCDGI